MLRCLGKSLASNHRRKGKLPLIFRKKVGPRRHQRRHQRLHQRRQLQKQLQQLHQSQLQRKLDLLNLAQLKARRCYDIRCVVQPKSVTKLTDLLCSSAEKIEWRRDAYFANVFMHHPNPHVLPTYTYRIPSAILWKENLPPARTHAV